MKFLRIQRLEGMTVLSIGRYKFAYSKADSRQKIWFHNVHHTKQRIDSYFSIQRTFHRYSKTAIKYTFQVTVGQHFIQVGRLPKRK